MDAGVLEKFRRAFSAGPAGEGRESRSLWGIVLAQSIGAFNDNAWKQLVALLGTAAVATEAATQSKTATAQISLLIPLMLMSLPAGMIADRLSKRTVIVAMKAVEVVLMVLGTVVLVFEPEGGRMLLLVLVLLGVQAAIFSPAKYGILPEILPHDRLSASNGWLEMASNVAILGGTVAGGILVSLEHQWHWPLWLGGVILSVFSVIGFLAAMTIPNVKPARESGGLMATVRMATDAIGSDRVLRLAVIGQILVWAIGSLVPAAILAYGLKELKLEEWVATLPVAALGIGIGLGCLLAGKLSAKNVEYGLLPMGALGLALSTLAFAVIGPRLFGTLIVMTFVGLSSGLVFVPLNALLQWRSPADRRGAVIALSNTLVYVGMVAGTALAILLGNWGVSARGTFLGTSVALGGGFFWVLTLVPDAFLRFILIGLANTLYRLRIIGREHLPTEGGALLVPNHVSFADGLFIIASNDRPVRFVVYAPYFERPILGRFLKSMHAIPISPTGGPKMILQAFREAGRALDAGELVCVFPEGQLTRNGMMAPFQRGLQRIVKGRNVPIIPVHLDRLLGSIFSPASHRRLPRKIPFPVTVSFGEPLTAQASLYEIRQAISELGQNAWVHRKGDRRPLHHEFSRQSRRHPRKLAFADRTVPELSYIKALAGALALARALKPKWTGQTNVGVLLPSSVGASLVNLAAALAGKTVVNLNFTAGQAGIESAVKQAGVKSVITSRLFVTKAKIELPAGVDILYLEDILPTIDAKTKLTSVALALLAPIPWIERFAGAARPVTIDDVATIIFSSGSTGEPKGVVLTHFNIDSNVLAIQESFRVLPHDRLMAILPMFHSFGYTMFWFAANSGIASVCHANPLDAAVIGELVQRYAATVLVATPTFLQIYRRRCTPAQFGSLRLVLVGAEKLPESQALLFEDTFGIRPLEGYGMTECAPVVAVNTFDHREPGFFQPGARRGFVGRPLPGVVVKVVSNEDQRLLGPDTEGMIFVKGPNVMRGYLGRDDLTAAAFHDGWYRTGDLGVIGEDGFLKITGRLSRFSKIGGEMVPHARVEEALHEAAGAEMQVFAVTAVGDERKGERLIVLHTLTDTQVATALEKLATFGLPNLFIPRRDQFIKVDALPLLGSGKLDLKAMRQVAESSERERELATTKERDANNFPT
jgi:acyl-[acyl-carrier-protein]-phospholipid O-acyltransferase/long-chain-fatty-acid--[acyl-carrier-protein] ligase